ncbi:MAG: response regulator [Pseudomonadales bacterium]|nr:response regulator [Pseudomonadales bacterium]
MPDLDIPILVVDDAKFSSAIIAKVLRNGGFTNVRFSNNPQEAMRSLEKRPAHLVIANRLMPSMDGLELTQKIRQLDSGQSHYTYTMIMVSRDELEALRTAFEAGVDDFLNKAHIRSQLLPRVLAAARVTKRENELIEAQTHLNKKVKDLQTSDLVDPVTGLGNLRFTLERLQATLQQSEARGGTACLLLVGINNLEEIKHQFEQHSVDEMMSGMSAKIRSLVRPLDLVSRPEPNLFAVITLQDSMKDLTSKSFKRIFDSLYMHSFRTTEGHIPVVVGVSITAANSLTGYPKAKNFMSFGYDGLRSSYDTGIVSIRSFNPQTDNNG